METELSKQAKELTMEQEKKINSLKEELEKDIRAQLKRQAGAHSDHLQDMLSVQVRDKDSRTFYNLHISHFLRKPS